jgi:predicted methyltransferase
VNYVLSHYQLKPLLAARPAAPTTVSISLDLNLSRQEIELTATGAVLPDGQHLPWAELEQMAANENACYLVRDNAGQKIQFLSEALNRAYTLYPTAGAPTMLVSGLPMHRIKGTDPQQDTRQKIKTVKPLTGRVLDTAMGLGYTAIQAAQTALEVITIELDPVVVEVCRLNPWSQSLFTLPNITRRVGDSYEEIETFPDNAFSRVIHDPPTFSLAGELYATEFYHQLYRVLAYKGRLFHYIGDLNSRSGRGVARGVVRRLQEVGFRKVVQKPLAFGLVAYK